MEVFMNKDREEEDEPQQNRKKKKFPVPTLENGIFFPGRDELDNSAKASEEQLRSRIERSDRPKMMG